MISKILLLCLFWLIVPCMVSNGLSFCLTRGKSGLRIGASAYLEGLALMLALFELVAVSCSFLAARLHHVMMIWGALVLMLSLFSVYQLVQNRVRIVERCGVIWHDITSFGWTRRLDLWMIGLGLLFIFEFVSMLVLRHYDADDAWYVAYATTALQNDSLCQILPYTGQAVSITLFRDYVISGYPLLWATMGKLFSLHPAVIMHAVLPAMSICWFWMVAFVCAKQAFVQMQSRRYFIFFVHVMLLFGLYTKRSVGSMLLWRAWQGKAILLAIVIPLLWYWWLRLRDQDSLYHWTMFVAALLFGWLVSGNMMMIGPILIGLFGLDVLINRLGWRRLVGLGVCFVMCAILALPRLLW